jgi:NAD(P)-dependent dehydrogenase (short-subunit alcohol dehydrogenase family)
MDLKLENKTAFITGSTAGIGYAIAMGLAREGVHVFLNGRTESSVRSAVESLKKELTNAKISGRVADFTDPEQVKRLIGKLPEIDILVNNVGIYAAKTFEETSDADWKAMLEINLMSGVRLSRALLPEMIQRNWGRILFISSECASLVPEDLIAYSCTKAAMLALSRGLAQTTGGTGVTVNSLLPGSTLTEGAEKFLDDQAASQGVSANEVSDQFFKEVRTTSILGRFLDPREVANTAVYLCSELSSGTNGAAIHIDGGSVPGIL